MTLGRPKSRGRLRLGDPSIQHTVLLLGNYRPALVAARALSKLGCRVVLGLGGGEGGNEYSRAVDEVWDHPELAGSGDAFVQALERFLARRPDITVVYPIGEPFVLCFAERGMRFEDHALIASVAPGIATICSDKLAMLDLATTAGVGCLPYAAVDGYDDLLPAAEAVGFPVVVRPLNSKVLIGTRKAVICHDRSELKAAVPIWPKDVVTLLVQRLASGVRHNVFFAAHQGEVVRALETRILRTDRIDGTGYAVDGVTVQPTPKLIFETRALAKALDFTGVGLAQFICDAETGRSCFLELNPRLAGSHAITEYAGQELTRLAIELAADIAPDARDRDFAYRPGIRYAWSYGDLRGIKTALADGEASAADVPAMLARFLWTAIRAETHMSWSWRDPAPAFALLKRAVLSGGPKAAGQLPEIGGKATRPGA